MTGFSDQFTSTLSLLGAEGSETTTGNINVKEISTVERNPNNETPKVNQGEYLY